MLVCKKALKTISKILRPKSKKIIIFGCAFAFLELLTPWYLANAGALGWIVDKAMGGVIISLFPLVVPLLNLGLLAINGVFWLASQVMMWVFSNPFGSFTNPSTNPIIGLGWTLMRDLVNTLLILVFAYIGLATALNISGFNTKKTFGSVLLVALLVNFTPVICGVIVDASNMLAHFFLDTPDFSMLASQFKTWRFDIGNILDQLFSFTVMLRLVLLIFYGIVGTFILLLFTALFAIRIFFIWFLVIFSPLAFLAWSLRDASSQMASIWNKWWTWFLQWSFIIVPAAFFLYLAQQTLLRSDEIIHTAGAPDFGGGFFATLAPPMVGLAMMGIGFVMTLQINAMGAGAVVGLGKKAADWGKAKGKTLAKKAPGVVARHGAGAVVEGVQGARAGTGWWGKTKGALKGFGKGTAYGSEAVDETIEKGKKKGAGLLERAHLVRPGFYEEMKGKGIGAKLDDEKKRVRRLNLGDQREEEILNRRAFTQQDKLTQAAILELRAEQGRLKDTDKDKVLKYKNLGIDMSAVKNARPDWTPEINKEKFEEEVNRIVATTGRARPQVEVEVKERMVRDKVRAMNPEDLRKKTQAEALSNFEVFNSITPQQIAEIGEKGTQAQRDALIENIRGYNTQNQAQWSATHAEMVRRFQQARAQGNQQEMNRIRALYGAIINDPNFHI